MKSLLLVTYFFAFVNIAAQTKDFNKLLDAVKNKFEKIKDYEVDITVKVDINFIKVPDTKAKIFFKQPDKVKLESKGFAMLPKQGTNFSPTQFLKGDYTTIYVKSESVDNNKLDVVKVIPNNDSSDIILSTLWIDAAQSVIRKIETTGKKSGTVTINLNYDNINQGLPSMVVFSFNIGDVQMPETLRGNESERQGGSRKRQGPVVGTVSMTYTNYMINKGIPDNFFEEKEKKNEK